MQTLLSGRRICIPLFICCNYLHPLFVIIPITVRFLTPPSLSLSDIYLYILLIPNSIFPSLFSCTPHPRLEGIMLWPVGSFHSDQVKVVTIPVEQNPGIVLGRQYSGVGAQETRNCARSSSGPPHCVSWGHHICSDWGNHTLVQAGATCFVLGSAHHQIV